MSTGQKYTDAEFQQLLDAYVTGEYDEADCEHPLAYLWENRDMDGNLLDDDGNIIDDDEEIIDVACTDINGKQTIKQMTRREYYSSEEVEVDESDNNSDS